MATTNTQVTAYLPEHILEYLTEYCTQYGIVRKKDSKPLLATGIVDLLNIVSTIPIEELTKFTPQTIKEDTLEKKLSDSKVVSKLLDTLLGDKELMQRLQDALIPDDFLKDDITLPDTLPVSDYEEIKVNSEEVEEEIETIDEEVEVITPKPVNNGNSKPITEEKELTEAQKRVMKKVPTIATGERFSENSLAKLCEVSRTVLNSFDEWRIYFQEEPKKKGKDYVKL